MNCICIIGTETAMEELVLEQFPLCNCSGYFKLYAQVYSVSTSFGVKVLSSWINPKTGYHDEPLEFLFSATLTELREIADNLVAVMSYMHEHKIGMQCPI